VLTFSYKSASSFIYSLCFGSYGLSSFSVSGFSSLTFGSLTLASLGSFTSLGSPT
jgi:hypothetical protein